MVFLLFYHDANIMKFFYIQAFLLLFFVKIIQICYLYTHKIKITKR